MESETEVKGESKLVANVLRLKFETHMDHALSSEDFTPLERRKKVVELRQLRHELAELMIAKIQE